MSDIFGYPTRSFSESQKFFVVDPATGTTSLVLGSDLVNYITPNINSVKTETTRAAAENEDYSTGTFVATAGGSTVGDGGGGLFLVVASGEGDFTMLNGNELLVILGGEAPFNIVEIDVSTASNITVSGSDLDAAGYRFTGTPTGNINVIVPDDSRLYFVNNEATGSNTITLKTENGSGVQVPKAQAWFKSDGTDIVLLDVLDSDTVDSVSDLQSGSFAYTRERLYLSGYYGAGTPGGGELYADRSDTTTADDGVEVFVDSDGVRWKRPFSVHRSVYEAGAANPGGGDDADALIALIENSLCTAISIPEGITTSQEVEVTRDVLIIGDATIVDVFRDTWPSSGEAVFDVQSDNVSIQNVNIKGTAQRGDTIIQNGILNINSHDNLTVFNGSCSELHRGIFCAGNDYYRVKDWRLFNIYTTDSDTRGYGILSNGVTLFEWENVTFKETVQRHGVYIGGGSLRGTLKNCTIEQLADSTLQPSGNEQCIKVLSSPNCRIEFIDCDIKGGTGGDNSPLTPIWLQSDTGRTDFVRCRFTNLKSILDARDGGTLDRVRFIDCEYYDSVAQDGTLLSINQPGVFDFLNFEVSDQTFRLVSNTLDAASLGGDLTLRMRNVRAGPVTDRVFNINGVSGGELNDLYVDPSSTGTRFAGTASAAEALSKSNLTGYFKTKGNATVADTTSAETITHNLSIAEADFVPMLTQIDGSPADGARLVWDDRDNARIQLATAASGDQVFSYEFQGITE